ncbi:hypothetical protein [Bdellovibrio sp. HCB337]|uniref:hypothetical protein n=1 Tax=Bdellovibrio sp. HCB337 TaxID=3394358 RepID=UPI0039A46B77
MKEVCETLSQIKPTSRIEFADGTSVHACVLVTENLGALVEGSPNGSGNFQKKNFEKLTRKYFEILQKDNSLTDQDIADLLRNPLSLDEYLTKAKVSPQNEEWIPYVKFANERDKQNAILTEDQDIQRKFDYTKKKVSELGNGNLAMDLGADKNAFKGLKAVSLRELPTPENLACRPKVNAHYIGASNGTLENKIWMTEGMTQMNARSLYFILGHELGHSFDPCKSKTKNVLENHPYRRLVSCLRDDFGKFRNIQNPQKTEDWCKDFHTQEAFCDYFGAYVLEQHINENPVRPKKKSLSEGVVVAPPGYENIFWLLDQTCADGIDADDTQRSHPSSYRRLKDILLRNPTIAKSVGCNVSSTTPRCDIQKGFTGAGSGSSTGSADQNSGKK